MNTRKKLVSAAVAVSVVSSTLGFITAHTVYNKDIKQKIADTFEEIQIDDIDTVKIKNNIMYITLFNIKNIEVDNEHLKAMKGRVFVTDIVFGGKGNE